MPTVTTYVDIDIDASEVLEELSDADLIAECQRRLRAVAADAMSDLLGNRPQAALTRLHQLVAAFVPESLLCACEAIRDGRISEAVCELDRHIEPSPAATVTKLPLTDAGTNTSTKTCDAGT